MVPRHCPFLLAEVNLSERKWTKMKWYEMGIVTSRRGNSSMGLTAYEGNSDIGLVRASLELKLYLLLVELY
jgi:hypothetical protein